MTVLEAQLSALERGGVQAPRTYDLLGFPVTPMTQEEIIELVGETVSTGNRTVICSQNLHGIYIYFTHPKFRALHQRAYVHIDGMPIVWLARLAGIPARAEHRTGWIDWFLPLMEEAQRKGWRVFYLGAEQKVLQDGLNFLRGRYPDLEIDGRDGFFDSDAQSAENGEVVEQINAFRPDLLIVGMGMGRQCAWILDNMARLNARFIGTAGACIEYFANAVPTPPRWLGPLGMEWTYRLATNPRRFAWRYLIEPWIVLGLLARQILRRQRDSQEPSKSRP